MVGGYLFFYGISLWIGDMLACYNAFLPMPCSSGRIFKIVYKLLENCLMLLYFIQENFQISCGIAMFWMILVYIAAYFCLAPKMFLKLILITCKFHRVHMYFQIAAIDLVDEAAAKLKMEITSKPTALDEINRSVLKLEMERLSLTNDTDKASKDRLNRLEAELSLLKKRQAELTEQWEHEKSVMTRIQSIKEEVLFFSRFFIQSYLSQLFLSVRTILLHIHEF